MENRASGLLDGFDANGVGCRSDNLRAVVLFEQYPGFDFQDLTG